VVAVILLVLQATAREMAGALSYLHSKNILHADLTGNNVLLTVTADDRRGFVAKVRHSKTRNGCGVWRSCLASHARFKRAHYRVFAQG
jgi:serine/threonine protein kinase